MFSLTRQERQVILFFAITALIGISVDFSIKKFSPVKTVINFTQDIGKINLNTASKDLLMSVSGIGDKTAERIIEYRKEKSGFSDAEELKNIKGITSSKFEKIRRSFIVK
jgi:competence ComEA-like helix-hairpin-helix protein